MSDTEPAVAIKCANPSCSLTIYVDGFSNDDHLAEVLDTLGWWVEVEEESGDVLAYCPRCVAES